MATELAKTAVTEAVWPELDTTNLVLVWAAPIVSVVGCYLWLRVFWPPSDDTRNPPNPVTGKTYAQEKAEKKAKKKAEQVLAQAAALEEGGPTPSSALNSNPNKSYTEPETKEEEEGQKAMHAGDQLRSYKDIVWTESFDLVFLIIMIAFFIINSIATCIWFPSLWTNGTFWLYQLPKLGVMVLVSVIGGLTCRYFCETENGYIMTSRNSKFRVNYTRKFQHFAAYAIPLVIKSDVTGTIALCWGDFFTLLGFLIMIKPLREMKNPLGRLLMLQFNSLDRPEDRPNTIKWIVGGNILPGLACILFFRHYYAYTNQQAFSFIWVFITGIGDGLAEPVGITWGEHKYWSKSLFSGEKKNPYYQRSYEGSCCVFVSGVVFTAMFWYVFENPWQFWTCMVLMAPSMAWAEAVSPHTMDTPFLMGLGGFICLAVSHIHVSFY